MIQFSRYVLGNGLRVLIHEDKSSALAAVNILYDIGSRDERPDKTGFAHLFEHLMFGGSKGAPDFDDPLQRAGGENNAFTNNDITNFYDVVPADNLETIFWLESDRMLALKINAKSLNVQKKVVIEEFKETTLNEPYGDVWHHLLGLVYEVHPYRWPTIGLVPAHIEEATLEDVKGFYEKYYCPNNAILTVAGNVNAEEVRRLIEKWFGDIPKGDTPERRLAAEPAQRGFRRKEVEANVPFDAIYMAFRTPARLDKDYYAIDLLTDVLSGGASSRLYRRLVKEQQLFTEIDCVQSGSLDPGMLMIDGKPMKGVSHEAAEAAIWQELDLVKKELIEERELQKLIHKIESQTAFTDVGAMNKAMNLSYYEALGDANLINTEIKEYEKVTALDINRMANEILVREHCSLLWYIAKEGGTAVAAGQLEEEEE